MIMIHKKIHFSMFFWIKRRSSDAASNFGRKFEKPTQLLALFQNPWNKTFAVIHAINHKRHKISRVCNAKLN